jgi:hypothetical protein
VEGRDGQCSWGGRNVIGGIVTGMTMKLLITDVRRWVEGTGWLEQYWNGQGIIQN